MRKENRKDDAISPVVGVMLMLVVTIVIAAVVVMFSTGLAGDTKTTPTAMFEVSNTKVWSGAGAYGEVLSYVNFRHKGGDVIPLSELQITLESVNGGKVNNGIIQVFTASDSKTKIDLSEQEWMDGTASNQYYQGQKQLLETKQTELVEFLNTKFDAANVTKYSAITSTYSNEDPLWDELNSDLKTMGMTNSEIRKGVKTIVQSKRSALQGIATVESEGWTIEDGVVIGKYYGGAGYPLSVLGQSVPTKSTVSTGEIIHVVPYDGSLNSEIYPDTTVKWTISYIPTNSIIAKGEFEVIAD